MVFFSSFSDVDCVVMPSYPEVPHYHDWRDALYQLDGFAMSNEELFDINRHNTKIGAKDDLLFGIFSFVRSSHQPYLP